jgi:magnesium chelatase subunit H
MMLKPTSAAKKLPYSLTKAQHLGTSGHELAAAAPMRIVIVTLDNHMASTVARVEEQLQAEIPSLRLTLHAVGNFGSDPAAHDRCLADIASADIIVATMLFIEDHVRAVLPAIEARRDSCDAVVGAMSTAEVVKLTSLGSFNMSGEQSGAMALLKKLRGGSKAKSGKPQTAGAQQMAMLKRLPKILRFIPGSAQDARAYFLTLQCWLACSEENVSSMVRLLVSRYASGPRKMLRDAVKVSLPAEYPDVGVYHPRLAGRLAETAQALPQPNGANAPTVGLLVMRSYLLAGNTAHYDEVISELERRGLNVVPAFSSGLDARAAIDTHFKSDAKSGAKPLIDALVSLTGFSLVGGPAYNDSAAAETALAGLDVPYIAAHAVEFQSLAQWQSSERGLLPVEATIMVAIPELDGATGSMVFGGRCACGQDMMADYERVRMLAGRVAKLIELRRTAVADRKVAVVLFNFPPNAGATGTAAYLSVFQSLWNTLKAMKTAGYTVDVPTSVDALRSAIIDGNASRYGAGANVHALVSAEDHVRHQPWLNEIELQWGAAPGRHQTDGRSIQILGSQFGNVLVGVQPAFGYEGDPMRLLFERGFAPTHAFAAFYRYLQQDFGAHVALHFGTHGALEFMPGKQTGLGEACWPDRLIGTTPNVYLYAANNPSEGAIAKRRAAATLVSYLTPPLTSAGLYRGLVDLKSSLSRWRGLSDDAGDLSERARLAPLIEAQAIELNLADASSPWGSQAHARINALWVKVLELEYTLIPHGLHVVGEACTRAERIDLLHAMTGTAGDVALPLNAVEQLVDGISAAAVAAEMASYIDGIDIVALTARLQVLAEANVHLQSDAECEGILHALDGRFVRPSPSGDLIRTPAMLPTGRNLHGFDPFRMPSAFALAEGQVHAEQLLARHMADGHDMPKRIALVLWGSDNLKSEGIPIAQALALLGARSRFDSYGRLCGAELIPLAELGRPRIDVCMALSGIFRDLLPLQVQMLAEAAFLAASADEPLDQNYVRAGTLDVMARQNCDFETAALRVFSNADGTYGANVNQLVESGAWQSEDELGNTCVERKGFAYGRNGKAVKQVGLLRDILKEVDLAYQNLESVELGVTTVDHYFDTLGGMAKAASSAKGGTSLPIYIGDQTRGTATVRTLNEQVALESRTRTLNPKWYEGLLQHGYEGVRQIEAQVTNTMGWSATTKQVDNWVYKEITDVFVLDPAMRARISALNPTASARLANRLVEAYERNYWTTDPATLDELRAAGHELEDRLEGVGLEPLLEAAE